MKITSIQQQVKQKDRYSIFVDGKYAFSLSERALLEAGISSGQDLDSASLKAFKQLSADDKAFGNALRYALRRARSVWEVQDYLRRKAVAEPTAEAIIGRLRRAGLLDDALFAHAWVANRRLLKPVSRRRLVKELKQKRVPDEDIEAVLADDASETDEREVLRELITKKRSRYPDKQKLFQYLARQGYGYDDISAVFAETVDAEG